MTRCFATMVLALTLAHPGAHAASAPWGKKPYGVLLAGPGGGDDWNKLVSQLRKRLGKRRPLETVAGTYGTRELQRALDRLQAQRVPKIVVVPLYLHGRSFETEQLRYLLGMRELPSRAYLDSWGMRSRIVKRAKTKVPLIMSPGLGDEGFIADVLLQHAQRLSRKAREEVVVLIGRGSVDAEENASRDEVLASISGKMLVRGEFRSVQTAILRPATQTNPKQKAESIRALRKLIKEFSVRSRVIVIPYLLTRDGSGRAMRKELDNLFYRWSEESLLPDKRVVRWIIKTVKRSARRKGMVKFKDEGKMLPKKKPSTGRPGKP